MDNDWDAGRYEWAAAELEPVARKVVELAGPQPGEQLLDLACGTGNAALAAARAGARAVGVDSARRLIEVARARATAERLQATFVVGDLGSLPFEPAAFDCVVSVFGLPFAPDPDVAMTELARVLRPGGRAYFTAWLPRGPIFEMVGAFLRAHARAADPPPRRFAWHDADAVGELAQARGLGLEAHDELLEITADSPESYLDDNQKFHPASLALRPVLERAGSYGQARAEALTALEAANEDPQRFLVKTPYRLFTLRQREPAL